MNANKSIKIVKREERAACRTSEPAREAAKVERSQNPTQAVARQVAAWVKEFQQRRVQESVQGFANLFQRA